MLQLSDIVRRVFLYPQFDSVIDKTLNDITNQPIWQPHGILVTDSTPSLTEGELWTFKPQKDRTWYLLKAVLHLYPANPSLSATYNLLDFEIDGNSIQPEAINTGPGWQLLWGSNQQNTTFFPVVITADDALLIRDNIGLGFSITTSNNLLVASVGVWFWIWEVYQTTPAPQVVTTEPAQTVNQSWQ